LNGVAAGRLVVMPGHPPNALVQLQAHYHHCGEAASENCLSAATFVRSRAARGKSVLSIAI